MISVTKLRAKVCTARRAQSNLVRASSSARMLTLSRSRIKMVILWKTVVARDGGLFLLCCGWTECGGQCPGSEHWWAAAGHGSLPTPWSPLTHAPHCLSSLRLLCLSTLSPRLPAGNTATEGTMPSNQLLNITLQNTGVNTDQNRNQRHIGNLLYPNLSNIMNSILTKLSQKNSQRVL